MCSNKISSGVVVVVVVVKLFKLPLSFIMLQPTLWTLEPSPRLHWHSVVPVSASCGWRMAWVVTLPVELRPLCHFFLLCVCVYCGTIVFVCLTSLPFVHPDHCKYNGYCINSHKEKLFLPAPKANVSPPSLACLVTPVTAGERGLDQS